MSKPDVMVFPLEEHNFNKAKSNIAAIEILYGGGICLSPQGLPEFAGTSLQFTKENIHGLMEQIMGNEVLFTEVHNRQCERSKEYQVLSVTNKQRLELIKNL
jgi:anthranilate/para-aminobenzoate synthase component II